MATVKEHVKSFEVCDITGTKQHVWKYKVVLVTEQGPNENVRPIFEKTVALGPSALKRAIALLEKATTPTPRNAAKIKALVEGE